METSQPSLLDWAPSPGGSAELQRRAHFQAFHEAHPEVYRELVRLARQAVAAGHRRIGIRLLWERLRWSMLVERAEGERYALNDHLPPYFARLIMKQERDLASIFEIRGRQ